MFARLLDPTNDFAFKKVFGSEKHKDVLIAFLNDILEFRNTLPIYDVEFLNPSHEPDSFMHKPSVLDILCKDTRGHQYIVEMQVCNQSGFDKRALYYASKTYTQQVLKNFDYHNLKPVIFIAICNFVLFPHKSDFHSYHKIMDSKTHEDDLNDLTFTFIELPKFNKTEHDLVTHIDKWCFFFKHAKETAGLKMDQLMRNYPVISYAHKTLNEIAINEEELFIYEGWEKSKLDQINKEIFQYREGRERGVKEGRKEGIEEGALREKKKILKALLEQNIDKTIILQIMQITNEEYENLK